MYKRDRLCQFVNFGDRANIYNMKYRIVKEETEASKFQVAIPAFDDLEANRLYKKRLTSSKNRDDKSIQRTAKDLL